MPSLEQLEKLEADAHRKQVSSPAGAQSTDMPPEYWESVLNDPSAGARPAGGVPVQQRRLAEIPRHVLRVACRRCDRTVEIQKTDAVRLYGEHAIWKDVGQRLLDNTCRERTGSYEDDGCWPSFS
jgi:hypothetical protein